MYGMLAAMTLGVGLLRDSNFHLVVPFFTLAGVTLGCRVRDKRMLVIAAMVWSFGYWVGVWPGETLRVAVSEFALASILPAVSFVAVTGLRAVAAELDELEYEAASRTASLKSQAAADAADLDARTTVHDHVLHALGGVDDLVRLALSARAAQAAVKRALQAVQALGTQPAVETDIRTLVDSLVKVTLPGARVSGEAPLLPPDVAAAMAAATGEALRNVENHAAIAHAEVTIGFRDGITTVLIKDEGVGFNLSEVDSSRSGIESSIKLRMAAAGGTGSVRSTPRIGTEVILRWAEPLSQLQASAWGYFPASVHVRLRHIFIVSIAMLATSMVAQSAAYSPSLPHATLSLLVTGLAATAFCWSVWRVSLDRLSGGTTLILLVVAGVGTVGNTVAMYGVNASQSSLWIAGGMIVLLAMPVFFRPVAESIIVVMVATLMIGGAVLVLGQGMAGFLSALLTPPVGLGAVLLARFGLYWIGRSFVKAQSEMTRALESRARHGQRSEALRRVLDEEFDRVGRFLQKVAAGELSVADPDVQATAGSMRSGVRDQLVLWQWPHLRLAQSRARRTWRSVVRCEHGAPLVATLAASTLLSHLAEIRASERAICPVNPQMELPRLSLTVRRSRTRDGAVAADDWLVICISHPVSRGLATLAQSIPDLSCYTFDFDDDELTVSQVLRDEEYAWHP